MPDELYLPTENGDVLRLIKQAAQRNLERDGCDEWPVALLPLAMQAQMAISAIVAGLELQVLDRGGWAEVAEGLVMLMQLEVALRQLERKINVTMVPGVDPESN